MIAALPALADEASAVHDEKPRTFAVEQLRFLWREMSAGKNGLSALLTCLANCFRGGRLAVAAYRLKRFWLLSIGRGHVVSLLWMWPIYWWCRQLGGRHEINPRAQIGCGMRLIHCSQACVVTPFLIAGDNLYLTGGNVIGRRRGNSKLKPGDVRLGDNVMLGICALVIGPLVIGNNVRIGAGAVVTKTVAEGATIVGAPVRNLAAEVETKVAS